MLKKRTNIFAQYVYNILINPAKKRGVVDKIITKTAYIGRQLLIKWAHDPLIKYEIGNFSLYIPLSRPLGIYQKAYPDFLTNQARIAESVHNKYPELSGINIGANVGDTLAIIRHNTCFPMLLIEGEEEFFSVLRINAQQFPHVELVNVFIGEQTEVLHATISKNEGTAHLKKNINGEKKTFVKSLSDVLLEYSTFFSSKFLIIDTDGLDCHILRGARDWIVGVKPVIFFEYDPYLFEQQADDGFSIFQTLLTLGYRAVLLYSNTGDYMCSACLTNTDFLEEMHEYVSGRRGQFYFDICVFADEDMDLLENIRQSERDYFKSARTLK